MEILTFATAETSNLTLEEIDFLFTKDGNTGVKKFAMRSRPVQESLRPVADIEADFENSTEKSRRASADGQRVDHIDHIDDKVS